MTRVTVREFTCDRCGATERVRNTDQPEGWQAIAFAIPILAAPAQERTDLCRSCVQGLRRYLHPHQEAEEPHDDRAPADPPAL